ncbi:MAG: hypothetical protein FJX61_10370 [Alphaproteobacteria bacterium]|nr:hypothetical protein [Alphaproteobacteria bacterium]
MSKDQMRYKELVDDALRGVVKTVLEGVAERGLPGAHHLYISFRTDFPGVLIPDQLRRKFPEEITIVLQHQFWGLTVRDDSFEVTLSFGGVHELLSVPFAALTGFVDPSVRFGLQFQGGEGGTAKIEPAGSATAAAQPPPSTPAARSKAAGGGAPAPAESDGDKVVTLDTFRKK